MNKKTRTITLSALLSALTVVSLYIASVWPTGQFGLVAFASLFVAAAVIEMRVASGFSVFLVSSALGMLILPNKAAPLLFILFFGYYPIIKSLIESIGNLIIQWILKLVVFNASLTIIWFFIRWLVPDFGEFTPGVMIIYLGGSLVFALFDYGFTKVIWLYINRISKYTNERNRP